MVTLFGLVSSASNIRPTCEDLVRFEPVDVWV